MLTCLPFWPLSLLRSLKVLPSKTMITAEHPSHLGHLKIGSEAWAVCAGQTWSHQAILRRSGSGSAGRHRQVDALKEPHATLSCVQYVPQNKQPLLYYYF